MTDPDPDDAEPLPPVAGADDIPEDQFRLPAGDYDLLTMTIWTGWGPQVVIVPYPVRSQGWSVMDDHTVRVRSARVH